ncbi:MFS family permease [Arthrobacter globiformis]|uniref:MFS transporter n=1 Tax=Arthrobacter globiformis TaxID=1665 RepID=UPI0027879632|nr:MFS transporter [Arthrobacter globiformis]MDQ1058074.1 MFS family permease [Arthrobacter globiformis]
MRNELTVTDPGGSPASIVAARKEMSGKSSLVVAGSALALSVSTAPLVLSTMGVFMVPVSKEFGWDRGPISAGLLVGGLMSAIFLPLVGLAVDRWGIRRVLPVGVVLLALNIAAISLVPPVLAVYIVLVGLTGIAGAPQNVASYIKTVSRWFDRNRGLAIGATVMGLAVGQSLAPQLAQYMVSNWGWRNAYVGLAGLLLVVALPALFFMIRDPRPGEGVPANRALGSETASTELPGISVRSALRTRTFWRLALSIVLVAMTIQGALIHVVPLLTDQGWQPAAAAGMLGLAGVASIVGRLGGGYLYDRFHAPYIGALAFLVGGLGVALLATGTAPVLGIMALGVAAGAETDLIAFLGSRYFGLRSFGQLSGYFFGAFGLGAAFGPMALGFGFDAVGSYTPMLFVFTGLLALAALLVVALPRKYTYPVE